MRTRAKILFFVFIICFLIFIYISSFYSYTTNIINQSTPYYNIIHNSDIIQNNNNIKLSSYDCPIDSTFLLEENKPKPDFLLIGVAKGGTTSFSNYLPLHPNVKSVNPKEPNYWTWKYRSTSNYQKMFVNIDTISFPISDDDTIISGEYTTSYILHPLVARRMHKQLPNIKIIILLRNPIDRAYSHYIMSSRAKLETLSFEDIINKEMKEVKELRSKANICFNNPDCNVETCFPSIPLYKHDKKQSTFEIQVEHDMKDYYYTSYIYRSIYDDSLERWFSVYPREQFLIIQSEVFYENTEQVMHQVCEFLGLPYFDFTSDTTFNKTWGGGASNKYSDPHDYPPLKEETRQLLREFFEPYNQRLYNILGEDFNWN